MSRTSKTDLPFGERHPVLFLISLLPLLGVLWYLVKTFICLSSHATSGVAGSIAFVLVGFFVIRQVVRSLKSK